MKVRLFRLKKGKEQVWKDWCAYLCEHEDEAKETMRYEETTMEGCFMFEKDGSWYVLGYQEGGVRPADVNVEMNRLHKEKLRECLEAVDAVEVGYHFETN